MQVTFEFCSAEIRYNACGLFAVRAIAGTEILRPYICMRVWRKFLIFETSRRSCFVVDTVSKEMSRSPFARLCAPPMLGSSTKEREQA
jgi:hypothetical protein